MSKASLFSGTPNSFLMAIWNKTSAQLNERFKKIQAVGWGKLYRIVNGKYDEATYRILWILKDVGISDERSEQVINEEELHKYGSSQTDV